MPVIQSSSPASLVARTLHTVLGPRISHYTYVDFCAGAGGPTPYIEADLNARLAASSDSAASTSTGIKHNGSVTTTSVDSAFQPVEFVLTDIAPHVPAWSLAAQKSSHVHYIPKPIDASNAPSDMLDACNLPSSPSGHKVFRLFSLAFHHFPDPLARSILKNTLTTSSGFAILELQARTLAAFIMICLMGPLLCLITPFYFYNDPVHLIFTYLIPVVPFVVVFDGFVSSLRTRTGEEVHEMAQRLGEGAMADWEFKWGTEYHTFLIGEMTWVIGVKK